MSMKKLLIALSLLLSAGLAGCSFPSPTPTPEPGPGPEPEVVYVTGISSTEEAFTIEVGEEHTLVYTVAPENATNKNVTVASNDATISIEGSKVTGVSAGEATVTVTTVDGGFSVSYAVTVEEPLPPVIREFPSKDIIAFFEEAGVADVVVPNYVLSSEEAYFEIDNSDPEAFVVYVTGSSHDEMVDYVGEMLYDNWIVRALEDGDYLVQFGETAAYASLVDFGNYIGIAFYVQGVEPAGEGMTPEEAASELDGWFAGLQGEIEEGVYYLFGAYSADSETVEGLCEYVDMVFEYMFDEFSVVEPWSEYMGAQCESYINAVNTVVEIAVYADTLYVDGEGYIVPEGTEGATAVDAIIAECYVYTSAE